MLYYGCPACGTAMSSPDSMAGQTEKCPECGNVAVVPGPATHPTPTLQPSTVHPVTPPVPIPPSMPMNEVHVVHSYNGNIEMKTKSQNGLGIASLVIGIIAIVGCWLPFLNMISMFLAVLGIVCGALGFLIALVGRKSGVGLPFSGLVVCGIAIAVAASINSIAAKAIDETGKEISKTLNPLGDTTDMPEVAIGKTKQFGNLQVKSIGAWKMPIKYERKNYMGEVHVEETKRPVLLIALEVTNTSEGQVFGPTNSYTSAHEFCKLRDNFDNNVLPDAIYQFPQFPVDGIAGIKPKELKPDETCVLVFTFDDLPNPNAKWWTWAFNLRTNNKYHDETFKVSVSAKDVQKDS